MKFQAKNRPYKRIALTLSLCAVIIWGILGTGASLAWFTDSTPEINNIFHFSDFELVVSQRLDDGSWEKITSETKVFNEKAIYEPGYTQVVYLKVENLGDQPFNFFTAINVNDYTDGTNALGQPIILQNHLKFGLTAFDSVAEMNNSIIDRDKAREIANHPLDQYCETEYAKLYPNETKYIALIVHMPESVNNVANYVGSTAPEIELGITVKAEQITN